MILHIRNILKVVLCLICLNILFFVVHLEDSEELVIPGDKQEINNFMELAAHNSRIQIDVSLPVVSLQLVSKHIFEVIYNRINSDLLLWEPNAPKSRTPAFDLGAVHTFAQYIPEGHDTFAMCKSGIQYGLC